jgi:hypothetical protein
MNVKKELKLIKKLLDCQVPVECLTEDELWENICFEASHYFIELSEDFIKEYYNKLNNKKYRVTDVGGVRRRKDD